VPTPSPKAWALAASALLTQRNGGTHDTLPDSLFRMNDQGDTRKLLGTSWGVRNRNDLLDCLKTLSTTGHRTGYNVMAAAVTRMSDKEFDDLLAKSDVTRITVLTEMRTYCRSNFGKSIFAWDFARYINLCRWGYSAGYLSAEEAWSLIMPMARRVQKRFSSWEELGRNFLHGRLCSMPELYMDDKTQAEAALKFLLTDPTSPWKTIPWDLNLDEPSATSIAPR